MTAEQLARLHALAFAGQGRAWSTEEFEALLQSPHVFVTGDKRTFGLGRVVVGEAELLTIATDPKHQGQGLGRAVLSEFEAMAVSRNATRAFLEVAEDNEAALALYRSAGYTETTRRSAYYKSADGQRSDAIIMEKTLTYRQPV